MPDVIIGHTTATTARIWVRGKWSCRTCEVAVKKIAESSPHSASQRIHLSAETDYTGTVNFAGLEANTEYAIEATFSSFLTRNAYGRFKTFLQSPENEPNGFSFVLSSCNLSVVSINNLLSFLLAIVGVQAADRSLRLPPGRWRLRWLIWLWIALWPVVKVCLWVVAMFVKKVTGVKQPPPPYLRSPFLKLSAVFESQVLEIVPADKDVRPRVSDVVFVKSGKRVVARGVVASAVSDVEDNSEHGESKDAGQEIKSKWRLVLTQVEGTFNKDETAYKRPLNSPRAEDDPGSKDAPSIGWINKSSVGRQWYDKPSFFIHAGDQIYYDFPVESRRPKKGLYRLAYREAWFDDYANRHLLSHWPHYMTLDDHEIADQFARDFIPQAKGVKPNTYLEEASVAYREYVQSRNPSPESDVCAGQRPTESFWYCFDKGRTRFFVLDTRTQRYDIGVDASQIIDERQMDRLLKWMTKYKDDLKFVITSVPFVAEIDDSPRGTRSPKWNSNDQSTEQPHAGKRTENPVNDKWSAPQFTRQRDQIIEHIHKNGIARLVFLTGDMHCCYHATMRIGTGSRYETLTVHELAGGPVNQLQLADVTDFNPRHAGHTTDGTAYEVMLDRFHGELNAVMHIKVSYDHQKQDIFKDPYPMTSKVDWNVIRTLTDDGASVWETVSDSKGQAVRAPEATMAGRITFVRKRGVSDLKERPPATA